MPKFRKQPVVIEAEQFWPNSKWPDGVCAEPALNGGSSQPYIETIEGRMQVCPGDWIITGVKGEKYPCKPEIFAMTYDPA